MSDVRTRTRAMDVTNGEEKKTPTPDAPELEVVQDAKPLAKLDDWDLTRFKDQKRILQDAQKMVSMLNVSYQVMWHKFAAKYELPDDVELNEKTGEIFAAEKSPGVNGKDTTDG